MNEETDEIALLATLHYIRLLLHKIEITAVKTKANKIFIAFMCWKYWL